MTADSSKVRDLFIVDNSVSGWTGLRYLDAMRSRQIECRARVEKHIKNTYLKRVDAPVGVNPALRCWMEVN
jgi:hypothetical protein